MCVCVFYTGNQPISSSHMSYSTKKPLDLHGDSFSWLHMLKLSMLAGGQHAARARTPSADSGQFAEEVFFLFFFFSGGKVSVLILAE